MIFTWSDWLLMTAFLSLSFYLNYSRRAQSQAGMADYLLGGRSLPWWLAGLSMVATTFAADTPLAVTELVATKGVAGNWLWWSAMAGGMLTVFVFAKLWQRSGVLTEAAFVELRYSGRAAAFLRGFKAVYLGLFMNILIIAWVNLAFMSLLQVFLGLGYWPALATTGGLMLLTAGFTAMGGLRGVAMTDAFQFVLAMLGCILLAYLVLDSPQIGGLSGLVEGIKAKDPSLLNLLPDWSSAGSAEQLGLGLGAFLTYMTVQWWASWYPGAEPGGGGYVAQRLMSTGSPRSAVYAGLLFQMAHYTLRPWPWIIVGLAAVLLYPDLEDPKLGYVYAMRDFLPPGLQGLLFVAFMAAYMSTISTQLNWGAGYLVHDLYRRFFRPAETERHYVQRTQGFTLVLMVLGLGLTTLIQSISGVWAFLMQCGAGLGLVLILRWFWWRINAQAEIAATLAPFPLTLLFWYLDTPFPAAFLYTVLGTTLSWLLVMYLYPPSSEACLQTFFERVHGKTYSQNQAPRMLDRPLLLDLLAWLSALCLAYALLLGLGYFLLGFQTQAQYSLIIGLVGLLSLIWALRR